MSWDNPEAKSRYAQDLEVCTANILGPDKTGGFCVCGLLSKQNIKEVALMLWLTGICL